MRGEDTEATIGHMSARGSPPHARGRHKLPHIPAHLPGITPACAGKTVWSINGFIAVSDHPRMRGEDGRWRTSRGSCTGSPPHARGRRDRRIRRSHCRRITPACAGKTRTSSRRPTCLKDHPRMRGEDGSPSLRRRSGTGSPPHARGRRGQDAPRKEGSGITPACAGKTRRLVMSVYSSKGSPPHARGRPVP